MKKRITSIILCFLISMSVMPAGFSAGGAFHQSLNSETIGLLTAVGVLAEDDIFIMQETETVTKGEFARVLLSLVGLRDSASSVAPFEDLYNDVKENTTYSAEIIAATKLGYFGKNVSGYFYPNDPVQADWALKAIMRALGYSHDPAYHKTDLTDNMKLSARLNRSNILRALYNALFIPVVVYEDYTKDGAMIGKSSEETVLEKYFDVTVEEGVVLSDFYSAASGERTEENHIRIGDKEYSVNGIDTKELVGLNVTYYVRNDDVKEEIIYIEEEQNLQITIPGNNLEYSYDNNVYTTVENGKRVSYNLSYRTMVSYNGYPCFDKNLMDPESGYVILIDNNNDKTIDVVKVMAYRNMIVFGNNLVGEEIQDKLNPKKNLVLKNYKNVNVYSEKGGKAEVSDIVMENILTVYESPDKANVDIYISKPTSAMVIDETYTGDNGLVIVADGNDYSLAADSDNLFNEKTLHLGQKYIFYLNQWNEIFYAVPAWASEAFWLLEAGSNSGSALNKGISLKGMSATGGIEIVELSDKVRWIEYGLRERISNTEALKRLLSNGGKVNRQLLKVAFDKEKKVNEIVIAYDAPTREAVVNMTEDYPLVKMSYIWNEWPSFASQYYKDGCFYSWLHFSNNCIDFCVNTNATPKDKEADDEDMYAKATAFRNSDYKIEKMQFYMNSKDSLAADYVIKDAGGSTSDDLGNLGIANIPAVLLNKIVYVKNDDDVYMPTLVCTNGDGVEERYVLEKEEVISIETLKKINSTNGSGASIHPNKKGLTPGDVIAVETNDRGEASGVILLYDYQNKHDSRDGGYFRADKAVQSVTGKITRKNGNIAEMVVISEDSYNGGIMNIKMSGNIIAYNVKEETTQKATINDLLIDDLVVVCYRDESRNTVVVYKE